MAGASLPGGGGGGKKPPPSAVPYRNPFRDVQGLVPARVDMGVDYQGTGPVHPIGAAVITEVDTAWAGGVGAVGPGTFIAYKLTDGPAAGHYVYIAENVTPSVRVGDKVTPDSVIGMMTGLNAGIETGWAAGPSGGTTLAAASGQAAAGGDPGAHPTAWGQNFSELLSRLGAPAGTLPRGGGVVGTVEGWAQKLLSGTFDSTPGAGGGGGTLFGGGLLGLPADVTQAFADLDQLVKAALWLVQPANWVRIVAGIFGAVFLIAGIAALTKAA